MFVVCLICCFTFAHIAECWNGQIFNHTVPRQAYLRQFISIYNAITLNKREIDRVHKKELYIATVSIKQKAVDCIKTTLQF